MKKRLNRLTGHWQKKYHPDLNPGDKAAEAKMLEIGEAWEVLGDRDKRKEYDQVLSGKNGKRPFAAEAVKLHSQRAWNPAI